MTTRKRKALHWRESEPGLWEARGEAGFRYEIDRHPHYWFLINAPYFDVRRIELSTTNNPPPIGGADTLPAAKLLAAADFARRLEQTNKSEGGSE